MTSEQVRIDLVDVLLTDAEQIRIFIESAAVNPYAHFNPREPEVDLSSIVDALLEADTVEKARIVATYMPQDGFDLDLLLAALAKIARFSGADEDVESLRRAIEVADRDAELAVLSVNYAVELAFITGKQEDIVVARRAVDGVVSRKRGIPDFEFMFRRAEWYTMIFVRSGQQDDFDAALQILFPRGGIQHGSGHTRDSICWKIVSLLANARKFDIAWRLARKIKDRGVFINALKNIIEAARGRVEYPMVKNIRRQAINALTRQARRILAETDLRRRREDWPFVDRAIEVLAREGLITEARGLASFISAHDQVNVCAAWCTIAEITRVPADVQEFRQRARALDERAFGHFLGTLAMLTQEAEDIARYRQKLLSSKGVDDLIRLFEITDSEEDFQTALDAVEKSFWRDNEMVRLLLVWAVGRRGDIDIAMAKELLSRIRGCGERARAISAIVQSLKEVTMS